MLLAKAKGHYQDVIMPFLNLKISVGNIGIFHTNLVIVGMEIKFGTKFSADSIPKHLTFQNARNN